MMEERLSDNLGKAMCIAIGLQIFAKNGDHDVDAQHDELFAGGAVNDNEVSLVESLGWRWQEEEDCWSIFT